MAKKDEKEVRYPMVVSTAPCNDDWFEGQSHKRIASKIADIILDDSQYGIIGIDGGWGRLSSGITSRRRLPSRCVMPLTVRREQSTFSAC